MKNRRSSNAFNKGETKTSNPRKNTKSMSNSNNKRSRTRNRRSNLNNRKMSLKRNLNSNYKKRAANRRSAVLTIRRSSGRREKFNMERMAQTVSRSGVPFLMARDISKKIAKKVKNKSTISPQQGRHKKSTEKQRKMPQKPRTITAGKVRQMVAEELIDRNRPDIAKSYSGEPAVNTTKHIDDSLIEKQRGIDKSSVKTQHKRRTEVMYDQSKRGGGTMT